MIIILLIGLIFIVICYILNRNNQVYNVTMSWDNLLFDELGRILNTYKDDNEFSKDKNNYYIIKEKVTHLVNKNTYNKYLFSFKPLKLEKWFTKEDLEFIEYLKQYRK